jgi:REP element-mobilizing transposase RayT
MPSIRRVKFIDLAHDSPEWVDAPTYFVTICTQERGQNHLCKDAGAAILRSIRFYHEKRRWYCELAVLMPDHLHLLLNFGNAGNYQVVVGDWKRWVTRHYGIRWQDNFFEHRVRGDETNESKALYILQNPVRRGLVAKPEDWPFFWQPRE